MSNGEFALYGYPNPMALDASPFVWGDTAQANEFDTSASASGHDSNASAKRAMSSEPETTQNRTLLESLNSWEAWGDFLNKYPLLGPFFVNPTKAIEKETAAASKQNLGTFYERNRNLVISVAIIVLALIMFSKGFSRIGEEGIQIIEKVSKAK